VEPGRGRATSILPFSSRFFSGVFVCDDVAVVLLPSNVSALCLLRSCFQKEGCFLTLSNRLLYTFDLTAVCPRNALKRVMCSALSLAFGGSICFALVPRASLLLPLCMSASLSVHYRIGECAQCERFMCVCVCVSSSGDAVVATLDVLGCIHFRQAAILFESLRLLTVCVVVWHCFCFRIYLSSFALLWFAVVILVCV
jgi:hypothetical protein